MTKKTKVIYRTFKNGGDVIAIFPEIPYDRLGYYAMSYQHNGQHGAASIDLITAHSRRATPDEISPLAAELQSIGYDLMPRLRETPKMRAIRMSAARQ